MSPILKYNFGIVKKNKNIKIGLTCTMFTSYFFSYFRNKDHWWGLESESKRLIKTTVFSFMDPEANQPILQIYVLDYVSYD